MADYSLHTSAVVKRYVQETGTAWIKTMVAPATGHFLYLARISEVEVTSALARRRGQPGLSVAQAREAFGLFRQDFAQDYRIAEITVPPLQTAHFWPIRMRSAVTMPYNWRQCLKSSCKSRR